MSYLGICIESGSSQYSVWVYPRIKINLFIILMIGPIFCSLDGKGFRGVSEINGTRSERSIDDMNDNREL